MRQAPGRGGAVAGIAAVALFACGAAHARDQAEILLHHAYGTTRSFSLEGRVAERGDAPAARAGDSRIRNLRRILGALRVEEKKHLSLRVTFAGRTWAVRSDGEGYFTLRGATPERARPGWNPVLVEVTGGTTRAEAGLLVVPEGVTLGIISDFDDTVVVSEVPDRSRLLAHTLLENPLQRLPVAGMADLYHEIVGRTAQPEAAPVIYLTASPRQLQPGIRAFLERNGFPPGPIIAKKLSDGGGGDPLFDQERYKIDHIERILEDLPAVRFVLVGDDGERDPEIFRTIRARHPARIEAVYIRRVSPDPRRPSYPGQVPPVR